MYRRVNSGRFIGLTTFGIVIVMAVFTWVMYGMAQQVFVMSDIMLDLSDSFRSMIVIQEQMALDIHSMSSDISTLSGDISTMNRDVGTMSGSVGAMTDAMRSMAINMNRMTYDVSQASYAMSNPMSYMWGNSFPF